MNESIEEKELEIQIKKQKEISEKQRERAKALDDLEAQIGAKEAELESQQMALNAKKKN